MSKSLGNYIGITEPSEQIYGKAMSIPDQLTDKYLRLVSGLSPEEIGATMALKPRDAKAALARRLVKRLHGEEAAARAEQHFVSQFVKKAIPDDIPDHVLSGATDMVTLLVDAGFATTRGDAKRLVDQGGVRVNNEKIGVDAVPKSGDVISARRRFIRLK
jgi:tyrosyl-tRNA synthetase